ncbi:MAG: hypothetical protein JXK93_12495 [Sphaerochaetaceae bacterium]|nr:hypothetical protein [Sphaerochaetaceae bacterium]
MKRRSIIILLVLVFLLVSVGLFARGGYRFDTAEKPYGSQRFLSDESVVEGEFVRGGQAVRQQLHTPGEDCPLGEDCLYLETGEVQYQYQDVNRADSQQRGVSRGGRAR